MANNKLKRFGAGDPNYIKNMIKIGKKNRLRNPDNSFITKEYKLEQGVGPIQDVASPMKMPVMKISKKDLKAIKNTIKNSKKK